MLGCPPHIATPKLWRCRSRGVKINWKLLWLPQVKRQAANQTNRQEAVAPQFGVASSGGNQTSPKFVPEVLYHFYEFKDSIRGMYTL